VSFSWGGVGNARGTRARCIWRNRRRGVNAYRWNGLEALDETHRRRRGVLAVHACPSGAVVLQFSLDPADSSAAWHRLSALSAASFFPFPACLRATAPGTHGRGASSDPAPGPAASEAGSPRRRRLSSRVRRPPRRRRDRSHDLRPSQRPFCAVECVFIRSQRPFPDHETTPNRDSFTQRRWRRAARPGEPWTASSPPATSQPRRPNDEAGRTIRVTRAEWWRRRSADEPNGTSRPRFPIGSRVYAPRKRSAR
jgi:hypothetical protein